MAEEQFGLDLGEQAGKDGVYFDPDEIRADLNAILADARSVTTPDQWDMRTFRYNRVAFPQMAKWLSDEEAAQLCFEFAQEIERIEQLMAA